MLIKKENIIRNKYCLIIIVLLSVAALVGCVPEVNTYKWYPGPELPRDKLALVLLKESYLAFYSLDGNKLNLSPDTIREITPGSHTLIFQNFESRAYSKHLVKMEFQAKAGDFIIPRNEHGNGTERSFWIDRIPGEIIASDGKKKIITELENSFDKEIVLKVTVQEEGSEKLYRPLYYNSKTSRFNYRQSRNGERAAFNYKQGGKHFMVIDGNEGEKYDHVSAPVISPDSTIVAYIAKKEGKQFVVLHKQEGQVFESDKYDQVLLSSFLQFSPDSNLVGFKAVKEGKWVLAVLGKDGEIYESRKYSKTSTKPLQFTPDSKKWIYDGTKNNQYFLFIADKKGIIHEWGGYDCFEASQPIISKDGSKILYSAVKNGDWSVVVNDKQGERYLGIMKGTPIFIDDDTKVVYGAKLDGNKSFGCPKSDKQLVYTSVLKREEKWAVVVDGKEGKVYNGILNTPIVIDNGNKVLYGAKSDGKRTGMKWTGIRWSVVVQGQEGEIFESKKYTDIAIDCFYETEAGISDFIVLRTGIVGSWSPELTFLVVGKEGGITESKKYEHIFRDSKQCNPDRKERIYAVVAKRNKKWFVVVAEPNRSIYEWGGYDFILLNTLIQSPDGKKIAYNAKLNGEWFVIVKGVGEKTYLEKRIDKLDPDSLKFSHDSDGIIYRDGKEWYDEKLL